VGLNFMEGPLPGSLGRLRRLINLKASLPEFGRLDHFFDGLAHLPGYLLQTGLQLMQLLPVIFTLPGGLKRGGQALAQNPKVLAYFSPIFRRCRSRFLPGRARAIDLLG
jgi:hypothetical protein